jgi:hypothetical protein
MKKFLLVLTIFLVSGFFAVSMAAQAVTERPDIQIMIDGKVGAYSDTPIIVNGRTLLPLRELFTNLGVSNDDQHIIWNGKDRSVTAIKDSVTIVLKVGNLDATINGKLTKIDAAPVNYHGRVYIPARSVAQAFDKVVVWDKVTSCVYIRDQAQYDEVKTTLDKALASMDSVKRYKLDYDAKITYSGEDEEDPWICTEKSFEQYDKEKDIQYYSCLSDYGDYQLKYESYYNNLIDYTRYDDDPVWEKEILEKEDYAYFVEYNNPRNIINPREAVYAALTMEKDEKNNLIYLKGNVYPLHKFSEDSADSGSSIVSDDFLSIVIDGKTGYVKEIQTIDKTDLSKALDLYSENEFKFRYYDLNGNFSLTIPKNVTEVPASYTITSLDGKFSISVPGSWTEEYDLNDVADLQASCSKKYQYMIALAQAKEDFAYDFEIWKNNAMEMIDANFDNVVVEKSEPSKIKVNGNPAVQYVLTGTSEGVNYTHLVTFINGQNYYGQIYCWTLKSKYKESESEFLDIVKSIKGL